MAEDLKFSYGVVHTYLSSGEYPPDCDKNYKRSLRRKAANFKVEEGRLYYVGNENEEEQRRIRLIHDEAHLGKRMRDTFQVVIVRPFTFFVLNYTMTQE